MAEFGIVVVSLLGAAGALFALSRAMHHTWHIEVIRHEAPLPPAAGNPFKSPLPPAGGVGGGRVRDSAKR